MAPSLIKEFNIEEEIEIINQLMTTVDLICSPTTKKKLPRTSSPITPRKTYEKCSRLRNAPGCSYARWVEFLEENDLTKVALRGVEDTPVKGIISGHLILEPSPVMSSKHLNESFLVRPKLGAIEDVTPKSDKRSLRPKRIIPVARCKNLARQFANVFRRKVDFNSREKIGESDRECRIVTDFLGSKESVVVGFEDVVHNDDVYINVKM